MHKTARIIHKWLMLLLGLQFVVWSVTGAYMVFVHIDYIHGDSLITDPEIKIKPNKLQYTLAQLLQTYPNAEHISVGKLMDQEVYRFTIPAQAATQHIMLSAQTGDRLAPLNQTMAMALAQYYYAGTEPIAEISLLTDNPPFELSARHLPAWRINFEHFAAPSIYISANSGLVVGKRHTFWRLFDWMFRFHVMDYGDAEEVDNQLLFWVAFLAVLATISGLVLTYFRVFRHRRNKQKSMLSSRKHPGVA
ncbi:PepSY domain-containing protein [Shewanella livingstonensis]|uniref:PepSY domain-containing protein n=1 Tax=Shewanella livingstonensis TaxID=150120 RepID=A0A3G8M291_9GAMM|nr:PepSY domain-containing protein [Shewanella livingstonensis]AZG75038.1 PepSY domain-containing protein [Shewanella livingstonensis]